MKQTQSRGLKWVSLLLLAAILTTTTPFSAAAENVHTALSDGDTLSAAAQAPAEDSAPLPHPDPAETETEQKETAAISESPDLSSLLFRLNEYDTFTAEEKSAVRSFFGMENDEEQMRLAASQETNIQAALDALSEPRRTEAKIANMAEKGKSFAGLTISERSVITEYLRRSADELAPVFSALEAQGYDLFACTLIAQITEDGLFTLSEAVTLYQMYDGRIERDQNLLAFRSFAKAFTTAEDTLLSKDKTSALRTEKQALRESKAAYISAEALKAAKQLLLNGYTASEIRAAYSVAAAFDLDPADLILSKASVPQDGEGQALLKMYPVALEPVKKALRAAQTVQPKTQAELAETGQLQTDAVRAVDYAAAARQVFTVASALYSSGETEQQAEPALENVQQPFDAKISDKEQAALNTGALNYTEPLLSVPGINQTSFELRAGYDSSESHLQQYSYEPAEYTGATCVYTVRIYINGYDGLELLEETTYSESYPDLDSALTRQSDLENTTFLCTIDPPAEDSYFVSETWYNTVTQVWVDNPVETVSETHESPAPQEPIYVDDGNGYTGYLYRGEAYIDEAFETEYLGEYAPGRDMWQTQNRWAVEFSGYLSKTITEGVGGYFDVQLEEFTYSGYENYLDEQTHNEMMFGIGSGWSFNIPSIDTRPCSERLILPGVGVYTLNGNSIEEYVRGDMALTDCDSYNNGQFASAKKLTFADGTVYYFNSGGLLLAMTDRFNNTLTVKYAQDGGKWRPSQIIDADGGSTAIVYADEAGGKIVTITAPDGSETALHVHALESGSYGEDNFVLDRIVYADGETTTFGYTIEGGMYNVAETGSGSPIQYALLTQVAYDTGAQIRYAYELLDVDFGSGSLDVCRLTERYTLENPASASVSGYIAYTYTGNFTESHPYKTKVTEKTAAGAHAVQYTFNTDHLCTLKEVFDGETRIQKTETQYGAYNLPSRRTVTNYGTAEMTAVELYTYDGYGNMLTYISPKGDGNASSLAYRTNYTYDAVYQLPLTAEYKQDAYTAVRTVNTLTTDKKNIAETCTYVNNVLQSKTTYAYNTRGQLIQKTEYPDVTADSGIVTQYTYTGSNLISITVAGMKDADGGALPSLTQSYTYDAMGRRLTATDGNGFVTATAYDARGRVASVTSPDGSKTEYTYDLAANNTDAAQSGRETVTYSFDGIGQRQAVYFASGDLQKEYFYDEQGRLAAEATGRGSSASNAVYYTYDALGRVTERAIYGADFNCAYRETFEYDDAYTDELSLVTQTVHGDTNAPSIISKTYFNKYGETVKTDNGGVVTAYEYDYTGNPIRVSYPTPVGGSIVTGIFTYDYRGNVLTETNAAGLPAPRPMTAWAEKYVKAIFWAMSPSMPTTTRDDCCKPPRHLTIPAIRPSNISTTEAAISSSRCSPARRTIRTCHPGVRWNIPTTA